MEEYCDRHGFKLFNYDSSVQNFNIGKQSKTASSPSVIAFSPSIFVNKLVKKDEKLSKNPVIKVISSAGIFFEMLGRIKGLFLCLCIDLYRSFEAKKLTFKASEDNIKGIYNLGKAIFNNYGSNKTLETQANRSNQNQTDFEAAFARVAVDVDKNNTKKG